MEKSSSMQSSPQSSVPTQGDIVVITQPAFESVIYSYCIATKGSIARALSFDEYCDLYNRGIGRGYGCCISTDEVKAEMLSGRQYPFRFEYVAPVMDDDDSVRCEKFDLIVLDSRFFRIISGRYVRLSDEDKAMLNNSIDASGKTIAQVLAENGCKFSTE